MTYSLAVLWRLRLIQGMPISKRRSYSFTKSFLNSEVLQRWGTAWYSQLAADYLLYEQAHIHGAEFCARMVLTVHKSLFENNWTNGKRQDEWIFPNEDAFKALSVIGQTKIRALPETAALAILRWAKGEIELHAFTDVPSPLQVLKLQSQGIRCISFMIQAEEILNFRHDGRDFYSFLIHDLIHAQLMTENKVDFELQMKFAQMIDSHWAELSDELSPTAMLELEYLASDMNSHIIHLFKTFKSWMDRHRPNLLETNNWLYFLPEEKNMEFTDFLRSLNTEKEEETYFHQNLLEFWKGIPRVDQIRV